MNRASATQISVTVSQIAEEVVARLREIELEIDILESEIGTKCLEKRSQFLIRYLDSKFECVARGISSESFDILLATELFQLGGQGATVGELGEAVGLPSTTTQRKLSELERLQLIFRTTDRSDRRCVRIALTENGHQLVNAFCDGLFGY